MLKDLMAGLERHGLSESVISSYDVLCLPENIHSSEETPAEAGGTLALLKHLRASGMRSGAMNDFGLKPQLYIRKSDEIWLGIIWILQDKNIVPIFNALITHVKGVFQRLSDSRVHLKIYLKKRGEERFLDFHGAADDLIKILETRISKTK